MPPKPASKSVTCPICQKSFSRTDHLKRHHLRHSGVKPYSCTFCHDSFTRSDNLRDHYPTCPQRNNRPIPESARGGRRSHACDTCTSMKLGCDGTRPCNTCSYKGVECKYSKLQSRLAGPSQEGSPADSKSWQENSATPSSDRGSIKFLLNSGTASFTDCFHFPPPTEGRDIFNLRNGSNFFGNGSGNAHGYSEVLGAKQVDWPILHDENLMRFMNSPIADMPLPADVFAPMYIGPNFAHAGPVSSALGTGEWEPASPQSSAILQALLGKSATLNLSHQEQADISQHLNYLFVPSKIENSTEGYFESWHVHCSIIHRGSFDIATAHIPLLISMALIGAMHAQVDHIVSSAKVVLDLAELFIYSLDDFTDEFEIQQMLRFPSASSPNRTSVSSSVALMNLQAAFLMVCVQFWAGNAAARRRALVTRYTTVVKVARRLGVMKSRHDLNDSRDEGLWIQKECQIRMATYVMLLDVAFAFFSNFPCRVASTEMKYDLTCEAPIFASVHPFSEPTFKPSRQITADEAFRSLFFQDKSQSLENSTLNPLGLNAVDMFSLIHLLYIHARTQISLFSAFTLYTPDSSDASTPTDPAQDPSNPNIAPIRAALLRWRILWTIIRANTPEDVWAKVGFVQNSYNYWLVTQLLVNHKGSVHVMMDMEVNCDDTLKQLQGLLEGGGADV